MALPQKVQLRLTLSLPLDDETKQLRQNVSAVTRIGRETFEVGIPTKGDDTLGDICARAQAALAAKAKHQQAAADRFRARAFDIADSDVNPQNAGRLTSNAIWHEVNAAMIAADNAREARRSRQGRGLAPVPMHRPEKPGDSPITPTPAPADLRTETP